MSEDDENDEDDDGYEWKGRGTWSCPLKYGFIW